MAHIQIDDIEPRRSYDVGATPQAVFTIPFPFFVTDDIRCSVGGVELASGFSVTGAGQSSGGALTLNTPVSNTVVTIWRDVAIKRTSQFPSSGPLRTEVLNTDLNRLTAIAQQLDDKLRRAIRLPDAERTAQTVLPLAAARAGKALIFDDTGAVTVSVDNFNNSAAIATAAAETATSAVARIVDDARVVDSMAALRAIPAATSRVIGSITLRSYHAGEDGGGGLFIWDNSSGATDDGGMTVRPTGWTGAGRWRRVKAGVPDAAWWGAKGDGVANDQPAFQAAVNYLTSIGGGKLRVPAPAKHYLLLAPISISNAPITLEGDGDATTALLWAHSGHCIHYVSTAGNVIQSGPGQGRVKTLTIRKIALTGFVDAAQVAIRAEFPAELTGDRLLTLEGVKINGNVALTGGASYGVWATNAGGTILDDVRIYGSAGEVAPTAEDNYTMRNAIRLDSTTSGSGSAPQPGKIAHYWRGVRTSYCHWGVWIAGHHEGIYASDCEIGPVSNAWRMQRAGSSDKSLVVALSNVHIDVRAEGFNLDGVDGFAASNGRWFKNSAGRQFSGNLFGANDCDNIALSNVWLNFATPSGTNENGIYLAGTCLHPQFENVQIIGPKTAAIAAAGSVWQMDFEGHIQDAGAVAILGPATGECRIESSVVNSGPVQDNGSHNSFNNTFTSKLDVDGDGSAVMVKATGTTLARALEDRFAETYSPIDFGADLAGSVSSSAAIQAAVTAAAASGRGRVRIPRGVFLLTSTITVPRGVTIEGASCDDTILRRIGDYGPTFVLGSPSDEMVPGVVLRDFFVMHDHGYENGQAPSTFLHPVTDGTAHVVCYGPVHCYFERLYVSGTTYPFIVHGGAGCVWDKVVFRGLWDHREPSLQHTRASVRFLKTVTQGRPADMSFTDCSFQGYLSPARSVTYGAWTGMVAENIGPKNHLCVEAMEVIHVKGGNFAAANEHAVNILPQNGGVVNMTYTISDVFFDGNRLSAIHVDNNNGAETAYNITVSNCVGIGQGNSDYGILVENSTGVDCATGLTVIGGEWLDYVKAPIYLAGANGFKVSTKARRYNSVNGYTAAADTSGVWIGGRSKNGVIDGAVVGGGNAYEPYGADNHCRYGVTVENPAVNTNVSVTGLSDAGVLYPRTSTAAAPSITVDGDADTGLYRPTADTVGIAVGGVGKVEVNSAGLGVGKTPTQLLDMQKDVAGLAYCDVYNTTNDPAAGVILRMITADSAGSGTTAKSIVAYKSGLWSFNNADSAGAMGFSTAGAERLYVGADGSLVHRTRSTTIVDAASHLGLRAYTVATLPSASPSGRLIYVSDGAANRRLAVSDGTNWRWPDGTTVS
ncbi:glycosyl hydrolase family 28-related protein [Azospirillum rugosum]|uniref:Rhamnogalacturonase A/B/Epimerase-like pectate lyase domain-containing protein n=1 Tax=Azospirillum rugosum TaxID=416170 RepID=A0ABS4SH08_9PROT|nr:glycosyl hydrolase family 28-related protein [Azospirillum rugosum]MBP2290710.1 hypothetical protein [Azospirillum rugosum]MDQ0525599.1 hypothetical protein [Azospirillum rugosum]